MGVGLNYPLPLIKCTVTQFVSDLAELIGGGGILFIVYLDSDLPSMAISPLTRNNSVKEGGDTMHRSQFVSSLVVLKKGAFQE